MKIHFQKPRNKKDVAHVTFGSEKISQVFVMFDGSKKITLPAQDKKIINNKRLISLARQIIKLAKHNKTKKISINFQDFKFKNIRLSDRDLAKLIAVNLKMANLDFNHFKTKMDDSWDQVEDIFILGKTTPNIKKGFEEGLLIGEEVNKARVLANAPGGDMTPAILAEEAKKAAEGTDVKVKVLEEKDIEKLKMGGVLGVAKGSSEKPRFIIMEYKNAGNRKPVVLVGKGVTFDTGGINLKPTHSILEMNMDMSGGAAVIHAIVAAAKLKLKKNIIALIPAVENMPSGSSYRPGDILRSMSGKTIEVLNTDAEGRIILSDALTYAEKYKPSLVIDVATLTGAAVVALGQRVSAVFTKNQDVEKLLIKLGEKSGDNVWPMPLWDEYEDDIKGTFGDWANTGKTSYGGAITAAMFLYQFAKNYNWAHIDIAPTMTSIDGDHLAKGAAGSPVRLLVELLKEY